MNCFERDVVITGMGAVTPIGNQIAAIEKSLKAAHVGAGPITQFDATNFPVKRAFEVKGFDARAHRVFGLDPFIQYAVASAAEALESAKFDVTQVDAFRVGLSVSSSKGGVHTIDRYKERFEKNPSAILGAKIYANMVPNFAAQWIARRWKIRGAARCYVSACATGTAAVIEGAKMVARGEVDYCLAGASDASIVPLMLAGYHQMKLLAASQMRPFHKDRDGFMVGEGAGIVFIESAESAKQRNAKVLAKITAYAYGQDTSDAIHFDPEEATLARTLNELLARAKWAVPAAIDYMNLHGTATREGDLYETDQIERAFGEQAQQIKTSSTKSMTGHMLGASGTVEIIAAILAMQAGFIPPTASLDCADAKCTLNYTPLQAVSADVRRAISFSAGFGGHVAAIALERQE